MDVSMETESMRLLETLLGIPAAERSAWLVDQRVAANVATRVNELLGAEDMLGTFLAEPLAPTLPGHLSAPLPAAGDVFGAWRLVREIGAGTMGVVFLAERADGRYEQRVAIKLMRSLGWSHDAATQADLMRRFDNERRVLARLEHPNIVRILDGGSTPSGTPYLVMEHVAGRSLTDYCDDNHLDVAARVELLAKVCDGVQAAHRRLIVHRDLKPQNVLVDDNAEPRVVDFGIARLLETDEAGSVVATRTVAAAMTPAYASPEQARHEPLTTASDVYSLGVMLYELLVGVRPYELGGLSPAECERVICTTEPPSLRKAVAASALDESERRRRTAGIGNDLERIVARALHKDPERRYGSAQALGDDLRRHLEGRPVLAHPDGIGYRFGKFVRRHRFGSAAAMLALVAIVLTAGVALWQAREARRGADDMRRINGFLLDVLKLSDPFDAGSELTMSQALDGAADSIDERFADRPDLSADIRFGIGYSMLSRYRLEAAEKQLTRALRESETAFGADDSRTLRVLEGIAGLRHEQGRTREAEALFLRALARIEATGQQADPLYVLLLNNLGNLYLMREDYPQSDAYLRRALAESERRQDYAPGDRANIINNLAQSAHGLEDLERADELYRQAQSELEALFPKGSPDLAILLNNRAHLAESLEDDREALALHRQSLAMRQLVFGGDHPMVVTALASVARMSTKLGDASTALSNAQAAAAMADRVYTEPNSRHASVHATLAEVRLASGDIAGAAQALQRAQSLLATVETLRPTVVDYLERVRADLCKDPAAPPQVCARVPAAVPTG